MEIVNQARLPSCSIHIRLIAFICHGRLIAFLFHHHAPPEGSPCAQGVCKLLTGGRFGPRENMLVGYLAESLHLPITVPLEVRAVPKAGGGAGE
jgi:hypothetical protein